MYSKYFQNFFSVPHQSTRAAVALLILRVIAGVAFIIHGWMKIQDPFHWMGPDSTMPALFQFLAAVSEFGGGIAWILGLLTPLASLGVFFTMVVAIYFMVVVMNAPFINPTGGPASELAVVYFAVALVLLMVGPGKFSLDQVIFGKRK